MNSIDNDNIENKFFAKKRAEDGVPTKTRKIFFREIPVVFLSFDEPNADENFEHLIKYHPNRNIVHRVHGVKGFDAAHKEACRVADSERFFTIDADCLVRKELWAKELKLDSTIYNSTFSWSSVNIINGLVYGNGGVKLWYSEFVRNMKTHEAAAEGNNTNNIEFCWDDSYQQMNNTYGVVVNNSTAYQAFRAGFREGIKMGLHEGHLIDMDEIKHQMYPANYARWLIWMTVGRDVENGIWAMYGARLAAYKLYIEGFDHTMVNDFDWFKTFWDNILIETDHGKFVEDNAHQLLIELVRNFGLPLVEIDSEQSTWFKNVNFSPVKGLGWGNLLNQSALSLYGFTLPR